MTPSDYTTPSSPIRKNTIKPRRGRPIDPALRQKIVHTAGTLFGEFGFHATTMEKIAKTLKISKLSLYSRFSGKEDVLQAVIRDTCEAYVPDHLFEGAFHIPLTESLYQIGFGLLSLLTSDAVVHIERILIEADNEHRAKLVQLFYDSGPARFKSKLTMYLTLCHRENWLYIPYPERATDIFTAMIKGSDACFRAHLQMPCINTVVQKETYCREAVRIFIAGHAPR